MSMGSQTVTFVAITRGTAGRFERAPVQTSVPVAGCLFRQLPGSEAVTETDVITEVWECVAPPAAAAVSARATGELVYDGTTNPARGTNDVNVFQITSVEKHPDFSRPVHHVTVICERQIA